MAIKGVTWDRIDDEFCETQLTKINKRLGLKKNVDGEYEYDALMMEYCRAIFDAGKQAERERIVKGIQAQITRGNTEYEQRKTRRTTPQAA